MNGMVKFRFAEMDKVKPEIGAFIIIQWMNKNSFIEKENCIPSGGVDMKNCILFGGIDSH